MGSLLHAMLMLLLQQLGHDSGFAKQLKPWQTQTGYSVLQACFEGSFL
jgi:hypothetical protein